MLNILHYIFYVIDLHYILHYIFNTIRKREKKEMGEDPPVVRAGCCLKNLKSHIAKDMGTRQGRDLVLLCNLSVSHGAPEGVTEKSHSIPPSLRTQNLENLRLLLPSQSSAYIMGTREVQKQVGVYEALCQQ